MLLRWGSVALVILIVVVSVVEYVGHKTPLEQLMGVVSWFGGQTMADATGRPRQGQTVIRMGVASWQMREFPWDETIRRYEEKHPDIRIEATPLPEGSLNSMLLFWASGYTEFDCVVAWADEEIHPFIDYNWNSPEPERRSLLVNVRDPKYLTGEQLGTFVPALWAGCTRVDERTGTACSYELPWMGEVLALNYNKKFLEERGINTPLRTWEEVEEASKKLMGLTYQGKPVAPLAMNFDQKGFFAQNCYVPMLAAYKKDRGIANEKGRIDVSSPEAAEVFKTLKRWYQAGYISRSAMVSADVEQDLRVMRAAMYPHWQSRGLWAVSDHGSDVIGIAPTPGADVAGSLVATYGAIIPKCSPHIKEAFQFCYEALCTDDYGFQTGVSIGWKDPETGKIAHGGKMPSIKSMYEKPDMPPGIVELGRGLSRGYVVPDPVNWMQCSEIIVVEFQKFLTGTTPTAEEALKRVQVRLDQEVYPQR